MVVEVWVMTIIQGKLVQAMDWSKRRAEANKRQLPSINTRVMQPATGLANRYIAVNEFKSYEERYEFWNNLSDEIQALTKEMLENNYFVPNTTEHYFYDVVS